MLKLFVFTILLTFVVCQLGPPDDIPGASPPPPPPGSPPPLLPGLARFGLPPFGGRGYGLGPPRKHGRPPRQAPPPLGVSPSPGHAQHGHPPHPLPPPHPRRSRRSHHKHPKPTGTPRPHHPKQKPKI